MGQLAEEPVPETPETSSPDIDPDRHFRTDALEANLRSRSVRGGAVTLTAQGVKLALNVGGIAVLARLLTPQDFGLVGMVRRHIGLHKR